MASIEERLAKATPEQLQNLLAENLTVKDERMIQAELRKRSQAIPTDSNPTVDPVTGQPTGGAPAPMVNFAPSAINFASSLVTGLPQAISSPFETIRGLPGAIADHYGSRYSSPEQAMDTFKADPFGAAMDVVPVGSGLRALGMAGRAAGATRTGNALSATGRTLERADPAGMVAGGLQGAVAGGMNRMMPNRTPEAVMAGTEYGGPQGRQQQYLDTYYDDVGRGIDEGYSNTRADVDAAEAAKDAAGTELRGVLDASDVVMNKATLVKKLMALQEGKTPNLDASYLNTIETSIKEVLGSVDSGHQLTAAEVNTIKSNLQGKVKWDAPEQTQLDATRAFADSSRVLRGEVRENVPGVAPILDEYTQLSSVEELVRRGHVANVPNIGGGTPGSFLAQVVDHLAPVATGQTKVKRNQIRRDIREGRAGSALTGLTDRTIYGPIREGAYLADIERRDGNDPQEWTVGRLWSN